jgi:hypothetical protein
LLKPVLRQASLDTVLVCWFGCRSVALADFEGQAYVLCGLGDGQLRNWRLDLETGALSGEPVIVVINGPVVAIVTSIVM